MDGRVEPGTSFLLIRMTSFTETICTGLYKRSLIDFSRLCQYENGISL